MRLYKEDGRWVLPGQQRRHARRVDIPGQPAAMVEWLNERDVPEFPPRIVKSVNEPDVLHEAELRALRDLPDDQIDTSNIPEQTDWSNATRGRFASPAKPTLTDVEEFIQDADPVQVSNIVTQICWRLKELAGAK
jgi:hypothetical protein